MNLPKRLEPRFRQHSPATGTGAGGSPLAVGSIVQPSSCASQAGAVGLWLGRRQSHVGAASQLGSNNLLEYSLHWETLDPQLLARLACSVPGQRNDVGFEHYLNVLHPGDVNTELKSIRNQLLDRQPLVTSHLRLKLDEQRCVKARVTRSFDFAPGNGELSCMQLLLEVLPEQA